VFGRDNAKDEFIRMCHAFKEFTIDGVIGTNTTSSRLAISESKHRDENGGMSGAPLFEQTLEVVKTLRCHLPKSIAVIGCGGIMDALSAHKMMDAGADLLEIYTGLIYKGPALISDILTY